MSLFKVETAPNAPPAPVVVYVVDLKPPSKLLSYDFTKLLYYEETKSLFERPEADAIYKKLSEACPTGSINLLSLVKAGG